MMVRRNLLNAIHGVKTKHTTRIYTQPNCENLQAQATITARIFGFMFPRVYNYVQSLRYIVKKGYFALK